MSALFAYAKAVASLQMYVAVGVAMVGREAPALNQLTFCLSLFLSVSLSLVLSVSIAVPVSLYPQSRKESPLHLAALASMQLGCFLARNSHSQPRTSSARQGAAMFGFDQGNFGNVQARAFCWHKAM